jgi:hypothetical protein
VNARVHEIGGDQRRRATHAASRVNPRDRLAGGTERVRQEELGHHDALEHVRRGSNHDRVDVFER